MAHTTRVLTQLPAQLPSRVLLCHLRARPWGPGWRFSLYRGRPSSAVAPGTVLSPLLISETRRTTALGTVPGSCLQFWQVGCFKSGAVTFKF